MVINASAETLWELMCDVNKWPQWKPFIISSSILSGSPLGLGSVLQFKPKLGPAPINLKVKISVFDKPRKLGWSGGGPGVTAFHGFEFEDAGGGKTRVISKETFEGIGVKILKLVIPQSKLEKLHEDWLEAIRIKIENS